MAQPPTPAPGARRPAPHDRKLARVLAVAGVTLLLAAFAAAVAFIAAGGEGPRAGDRTAGPKRTATPAATPTPSPTPVPLTAGQRAERAAAAAVVESRGFEVTRLRDWDPQDTLRVLVGRRSSTGGRLAFFFVNGDYIGNDSTDASADLRVRRTSDLTATLRYVTYAPGNDADESTGEPVDVRFTWDGAQLTPDGDVPPRAARTPGAAEG